MLSDLRFELSFKNIDELENKLNFCKINNIYNINIPCKGLIKNELLDRAIDYVRKNHKKFNVTCHYSLYHQYSKNKENSYQKFLNFVNKFNSYDNYEILLVSGSIKKKNFDVIDVLNTLKKEQKFKVNLGTAYNPYLNKYFNISSETERYEKKISSGLVKSTWLQFGTDLNLLASEVYKLRQIGKNQKMDLFGSLLIPSKQFLARFKFRPWRGVYISDKYSSSLEEFYFFTKDLVDFYYENNITPVIETDFSSLKKLNLIYDLVKVS